MVKYTIVGNRDLAGRFTAVVEDKRRRFRQANRDTAADVMRRWRERTRSRRIARGLRAIPEGDARIVISVGREIGFDPAHEEFDTKPHVIEAKSAKVLRFEIGGRVIFSRRVKHPGTTGSHAGSQAVRDAAPAHKQRITDVWRS